MNNTPDCGSDPGGRLKELFIDATMGPRIAAGQHPVRRAVFLKPHGVAKASFVMQPSLSAQYRVGIFRHERFEAWVRFSSDTVPGRPDKGNTAGVGIKLFGVPGDKLLPGDEKAVTADLLMQNSDVFFVDTAKDMCEFTQASLNGENYKAYLKDHPETKRILAEMENKKLDSCLTSSYWSSLPYAFGDKFVKYKLEPNPLSLPDPLPQSGDNFLAADLRARLNLGEVQFKFMIQLQTDDDRMPLDRATVQWSEKDSPPVQIATLIIPRQDVTAQGQAEYGENLSFNPWRTLAEHRPAGSIGEVRKHIYQAGATLRRYKNGIPAVEPQEPRTLDQPQ
jgi:hypothetical protein